MVKENDGIGEWTRRIRAELCLLDAPLCDAVLDALLESGFLRRRRDNTYCRADSGL